MDGKENKCILNQIKPHLSLEALEAKITKLKLMFWTYYDDSLEKTIMLGTAEGKTRKRTTGYKTDGRNQIYHEQAITKSLKTQTEDRNTTHSVARRQNQLDSTK